MTKKMTAEVSMRDVRSALVKLAPKNREPILLWVAQQESLIESLQAENERLRGKLWRLDDLLGDIKEFLVDFPCLPPTLEERIKAALSPQEEA